MLQELQLPPWKAQRTSKGKLSMIEPQLKEIVFQLKKNGVSVSVISRLTKLDLSYAAVNKIADEVWTIYNYNQRPQAPATKGEIKKPEDIKVEDPETYGDGNK